LSIINPPELLAATVTAEALNAGCACRTLDLQRLRQQLERDPALAGLTQSLRETRPHLFSSTVVFVSPEVAATMAAVVTAIERVVALPAYQAQALQRAPAIASHDFGPKSVFMGYDFHLRSAGLRLIEINTNAGGALLNGALARAQQACCAEMDEAFRFERNPAQLEQRFVDMFVAEWRSQRGQQPIGTLAIVDDDPHTQYLAAEFELFRQLAMHHGIAAQVIDAAALQWRAGRLWFEDLAIDLVYNRLTDFYLAQPNHAALREAYAAGAVVLTPHPRAHALYAEKRNLTVLSNDALLASWGVADADRALLRAVVPETRVVEASAADALWASRKHWFFKPVGGYGGKAAYRGDKLTRRVWGEILSGDFVAQALVPPGERLIDVDGTHSDLKFDLRAYTYDGQIQSLAARIYSGQTTNFRTQGGGFAPVLVV